MRELFLMFETAHRAVATTTPSKTKSRHAVKRDGSVQVAVCGQQSKVYLSWKIALPTT
jgi:hypothetical protein